MDKPPFIPAIITLIGSSKFMPYFSTMMWEIEKRGIIALGLHWVVPVEDNPDLNQNIPHHLAEYEGVSDILDDLHLRKIDLADEVLCLAIDGYIGKSTARELDYTERIDIPIVKITNWQECQEYLEMLDRMIEAHNILVKGLHIG